MSSMSVIRAPLVEMCSAAKVPVIGLGTWKSKPGEVQAAVETAISCGYRHIDCAAIYGNEKEVGLGIKQKIQDGTVERKELFVTSKLWNECHSPDNVQPALKRTLADLQLNYVDLYLIHWPFSWKKVSSGAQFGPYVDEGIDYVDTWKAMESLVKSGLARSIGLSNFNSKQIQKVLDKCEVKPAMLQVEIHPYLNNSKLVDFCKKNGITVTAYSPFASPDPGRYGFKETDPSPMKNEKIKEIAKTHQKTPAQIILRWLIQRDVVAIPKSVTKERIESNLDLFSFSLSPEEMEVMSSLDEVFRCCDIFPGSQHYPFSEVF